MVRMNRMGRKRFNRKELNDPKETNDENRSMIAGMGFGDGSDDAIN